jgi:hypothetical protein
LKSKRLFTIIGSGLLATIFAILYLVKSLGYGMEDNATHYSNGINESKANGMFLGYYKPLQDSILLGDLTLKTENIWYEKNWTTDHNILFQKSIKIDSGIHFIAPYPSLLSSDLNIDLCLKEHFPNCPQGCFVCIEKHSGLGYAYSISTKPDTLVLQFGKDNGVGHKDTITYVQE